MRRNTSTDSSVFEQRLHLRPVRLRQRRPADASLRALGDGVNADDRRLLDEVARISGKDVVRIFGTGSRSTRQRRRAAGPSTQ